MEETEQERAARRAQEIAAWDAENRRRYAEKRVPALEECFEMHSVLLCKDDKREFYEFLPKIVELFEKDANMMKKMEEVKDQKGLEAFLSTWYNRLDLEESEMERLNEWLKKFEKQVMWALRQKTNIQPDNSFDFFANLEEKAFRRRMRQITADELQRKIQQEKHQQMKIEADEIRKTFASLNMQGLSDELINEMAEHCCYPIEAQRQGSSSEPVPMRLSQSLRDGMIRQLPGHFQSMNLSEQDQVVGGDDEEEEDEVQVVELME